MQSTWKWIVVALAVVVLLLGATWMSCSSSVGPVADPSVVGTDGAVEAVLPEVEEAVVSEEAAEPVETATEPEEVIVGVLTESLEPLEVLSTLAEKFVAAGGQKLCLGMIRALNPDWRMDVCQHAQPGPNGEDRQTECENQRRPLVEFAEAICKTAIEESLRLDLDPAMVLAVIERESSFGRATWDRQDRRYEVQTDICKLTLPKSRIVDRRPGRREGTELLTWTYGDRAPNAGAIARNRQPVIVVEEDDERVVLDTCAAGEVGIMQTVPREFRAGTVVEATGEELVGSGAERRHTVEEDPVLQVRLGCQALASHRDLVPDADRDDFLTFLFSYNTGTERPTDHGRDYMAKIVRHYLAACTGWFQTDPDDPTSVVDIEDVWPECGRLRNLQRSEE